MKFKWDNISKKLIVSEDFKKFEQLISWIGLISLCTYSWLIF